MQAVYIDTRIDTRDDPLFLIKVLYEILFIGGEKMEDKRIITSADEVDASIAGTTSLDTFVCECRDKAEVANGVCVVCGHTFVAVWETDRRLSIYSVPLSAVSRVSAERYLVKREVVCPYCGVAVVKSDPASDLYNPGSPHCEACGSVVVPICYVSSGVWHLHLVAKTGYDSFLRSDVSALVVDKTLLNAKVADALEVLDLAAYLSRISRPMIKVGMTPTEIRTVFVHWFVDVSVESASGYVLTRQELFESYEQAVISQNRELPANKRDKELLLGVLREKYPDAERRGRLSKDVVSRYFDGLRIPCDAFSRDIPPA